MKLQGTISSMKDQDLMSIGEASRITGMHVKSLRYYDRMGVFSPEYVDPKTGYRYYSFEQLQNILAVQTCLNAGIALSDLEQYRTDGDIDYTHLLKDAGTRIDRRIEELNQVKSYLEFMTSEVDANEKAYISGRSDEYRLTVPLWKMPITEDEAHNCSSKDLFIKMAREAQSFGHQVSPLYFGMLMICDSGNKELYAIGGIEHFLNINDSQDSEHIFHTPAAWYRRVFHKSLDVTDADTVFPDLFAQDYRKVVISTVSLSCHTDEPLYSMYVNLPDKD